MLGSQNQTYRAGREILQLSPDHLWNVEAVVRSVQEETTLLAPIIQEYVETSRCSYQKLLKLLVRVPSSRFSAGHIVKVVHPSYLKRNMVEAFDEGEVTSPVADLRELDDST